MSRGSELSIIGGLSSHWASRPLNRETNEEGHHGGGGQCRFGEPCLRVEECNMEVSQVEKQGMWARRMGTARVNSARYINWSTRSYRYL